MAITMDKCTARVRVRDAHGDVSTLLQSNKKENKKKKNVYCIWRCSQAEIQSRYLHKPRCCAPPRLGDA